jgi:phage FluMu gp28-like protein
MPSKRTKGARRRITPPPTKGKRRRTARTKPARRKMAAPGRELLPYQKAWANDKSRWKFGLMSRQVGKDFGAGFEGVRDCVEADLAGKKVDWLIAAPSERQSLESFDKWKYWCESFKVALKDEHLEREGGREGLLKSATVVFPHGSRIIAVPGHPDTVRGFSANVLLTEFAFFENPDATWRAILPSVTNTLRGGEKKVRLITTPNGIGNKAHDIWAKNYRGDEDRLGGGLGLRLGQEFSPPNPNLNRNPNPPSPIAWSCHLVDIYAAVAQGLPVNVEELKSIVDDPEGWAQEYECQFLDVQSVLLPYELLATCESDEATAAVSSEFWQTTSPHPIDMGIDFGRKHDLTVCWSNARIGDVAQTIEVLELANMSTPEQVDLLRPRLKRARRVCLDYTGPGIGMGDYLVREFQEWKPGEHKYGKIELCVFSQGLKVELFSKLRMAFENRGVRVPVNRAVREDLHSISRVASETGGITYRAPRGVGGHADRCTALALALRAGQGGAYCGGFHLFQDKHTERALIPFQHRSTFP